MKKASISIWRTAGTRQVMRLIEKTLQLVPLDGLFSIGLRR